jgi:hypothetical protein
MTNEADKAQGKVRRKAYYTPMPNNLFFVGAFPELTPSAVLGLMRHFFLAMRAARKTFGEKAKIAQAWSVTYEALDGKIGSTRMTAGRINKQLLRWGYVELVRTSGGRKAATYCLGDKLRESVLRTIKEVWDDRMGRPRKRHIGEILKRDIAQPSQNVTVQPSQNVTVGPQERPPSIKISPSTVTKCYGSTVTKCYAREYTPRKITKAGWENDSKMKKQRASDRGLSPPVTPRPSKPAILTGEFVLSLYQTLHQQAYGAMGPIDGPPDVFGRIAVSANGQGATANDLVHRFQRFFANRGPERASPAEFLAALHNGRTADSLTTEPARALRESESEPSGKGVEAR